MTRLSYEFNTVFILIGVTTSVLHAPLFSYDELPWSDWTIFITALLGYCCVIHITINCHWRGPSKVQRIGVVTRRRSFNSAVVVIVVVTLMVLRSTAATTFVVTSVVVSSTSVVVVLARGQLHGLVKHGVVVVGRGYGVIVVIRQNRSVMAVATPVGIVAAIPRIDVVGVAPDFELTSILLHLDLK